MLGVIIGVIALVVLVGIGTGMTSYMKQETDSMMGDIIIVNSTEGGPPMASTVSNAFLSQNAVSQIENMSQLYNISVEDDFISQINGTSMYIMGTTTWSQLEFNGTPGVVITKNLVDQFGYKIGSNITIGNESMTITGISNTNSNMYLVMMDISKALPLNNYQASYVTADTRSNPETVKDDVQNSVNGTSAYTQSDEANQINSVMNVITLVVGVISIVNIMLVNVTERTREIGVLKAIGFTDREILSSVLLEAGLVGFIGSTVGVVIAVILLLIGLTVFSQQVGNINLLSMVPFWLIAGVIGGSTILSILAGLYPAWHASRLNVVEALRNE
jgi:putative ABC transport system permease protein